MQVTYAYSFYDWNALFCNKIECVVSVFLLGTLFIPLPFPIMIRTPNYVITIVHVVSAFYGYMIYTRFLFLYNDIVN